MLEPMTALGIAMKAVGWIASPIICDLFKKCSTYLSFDASEKLQQLGPKVLLLERVMEAFEQIPDKPRLERLFQDLKSAFYEAEDILDDVEYHCLEKKIQDCTLKSDSGALRHKRCWVKKLLPMGSPLKNKETGMQKKQLKDSLERIEKIINNAYKFVENLNLSTISNFNEAQADLANSRGVVTTSSPPTVVIGRDKDCDKIIEMLHEKEGEVQTNTNSRLCYSTIGIHGIGGSGKSTLAQLVCAREKKDMQEKRGGHFDLVMWVHVSQSFSVGDIFKEIFEAATGNQCPQLNNLNTLQVKVEEELHGKRFLLVLDDVWCSIKEERKRLELRQILFPMKAGEEGSKILVTSRTKDALLVLGATEPRCIPICDLDDNLFLNLLMNYALEGAIIDDHVRRRLEAVGADIAKKLKRSPLAARIVGGRLRRRPNAEFWTTVKNGKLVNETMGALWWSYLHLDQQARRCFSYCSIFPRRHPMYRTELVNLWVAEGFVRSTNEGEDIEDVCREYFDELVSTSFLQPGGGDLGRGDYYLVHDLLHDLAEMVAGSDCFRIENGCRESGFFREGKRKSWTGDVPRDVRHLFVQNYDGELITDKILELENLRTLIIYAIDHGTSVEEKIIECIFKRLPRLRVLAIALSKKFGSLIAEPAIFSAPESISQLKHLRYLAFRTGILCRIILPSTLSKLYHIQLLDFGQCQKLEFPSADLINLRHIFCLAGVKFCNVGRLISLQTLRDFIVTKEQGYEIKQLRDLNKLRGKLWIHGLGNVKSKDEALEANLAAKEWLTELTLCFDDGYAPCSPEVEAEILEALCPPMGLERLEIWYYNGLGCPNWIAGKHNGGPENLQEVEFSGWSQLGPAPELGAFPHLRLLTIWECEWSTLPDNIEQLTSLKRLVICQCLNIRCLPTLPQSINEFKLIDCNKEFMESCRTKGDPNWQKIEHIPLKKWHV
ncbi:putative disease resistance RPP13-like protein 1 [Lolium rigidum]|uniref:putative disease resistance RPP13-like protein 1 n=1 Tax=Lolium rigidum TaxID=89674 RepID=UPI001F5C7355|nr:putative disease resistance RPP13-like protein 1 [Lolium rigidum]XP_047091271.1 putative disease resistance RPP13-like protein 1 [Lolium rigidum]XP_047091272.1 putative disease resistance RPP13-like protein 1 [Lolium rigidum]